LKYVKPSHKQIGNGRVFYFLDHESLNNNARYRLACVASHLDGRKRAQAPELNKKLFGYTCCINEFTGLHIDP